MSLCARRRSVFLISISWKPYSDIDVLALIVDRFDIFFLIFEAVRSYLRQGLCQVYSQQVPRNDKSVSIIFKIKKEKKERDEQNPKRPFTSKVSIRNPPRARLWTPTSPLFRPNCVLDSSFFFWKSHGCYPKNLCMKIQKENFNVYFLIFLSKYKKYKYERSCWWVPHI